MGAIATLSATNIAVEPGGEATLEITVRNAGDVVDEFTFQVLGDPSPWTTVTPESLRLFPGGEERATVTFRPPRSHEAGSGDLPFGIKVIPKEDPDGSAVEEGIATVLPFRNLFAELLPRTTRGRGKAKHELALDNRGNSRVNAELYAADPEDSLEVEFDPPAIVSEPGTAAFANVVVKPERRHWRGPSVTRPFQVFVQPEGQDAFAVDGTMLQEAVIPKWLPRALLFALLGLALLLALWQFALSPTIESAARSAAEEAVAAPLEAQAAAIQDLQDAVAGVEASGEEPDEPPAAEDPPEPVASGPVATQEPFDIRLAVTDSPGGGTSTESLTVGEGETIALTDVVLQNPGGHAGELQLRRDGQVLLIVALENFRDLDYHFVAPIIFREGQSIVLELRCDVPTEPATACTAGAYLSGSSTSFVDPDGSEA